ncbi:phosphotransferase family enzyme [Roseovarius halotolerans]|uniref:Phosphotransferase enzyme family protein n=1 Tax=Roseovarius halotolerans TaxID=505353 RepID=A0A1X6YN49_9RHOB|nr:phosphotransferase [Roseovarius halotolerans]RKT34231.1 phosphotransferase family enzyme [Roseovarius halotolerans]SLN25723.1 Phosphotransferase enzyme family protein [Roseovarius halotolerans]
MTKPDIPEMDAMIALAARFEAAVKADPALEGAELGEMLRHVPGKRAICRGTVQGRECIWRVFHSPQDGVAGREWVELQRVHAGMRDDDHTVNAPLYHAPEFGLVAVEFIAGTPLMALVWQSPLEEREALIIPAARWLRRYTESSESWWPAKPEGWLKRAERAAAKQPFSKLHRLERPILAELARLLPRIEGLDWRTAICHGDFHPNNLIVDGARMTGIDNGGSARMPIYKDMARFLMHMGRRGLIPSGSRVLGVDGAMIEAFSETFAMTEAERRLILPFMLGIEALIRVEHADMTRSRVRRAHAMYEALLEDLRKI